MLSGPSQSCGFDYYKRRLIIIGQTIDRRGEFPRVAESHASKRALKIIRLAGLLCVIVLSVCPERHEYVVTIRRGANRSETEDKGGGVGNK